MSELIRVIRFSISAEYEAIQLYQQIMEATDNDLVKKVVADITNEERLHAGQFLDLLYTLEPDEKAFYEKGEHENSELAKQPEAPKPRNGLLQ